jgi:hypothetical protein
MPADGRVPEGLFLLEEDLFACFVDLESSLRMSIVSCGLLGLLFLSRGKKIGFAWSMNKLFCRLHTPPSVNPSISLTRSIFGFIYQTYSSLLVTLRTWIFRATSIFSLVKLLVYS